MTDSKQKVNPILIGPANAIAATGLPWRWCRDTASELGVPFVGARRKRAIRADAFVAALEGSSRNGGTANGASAVDPAEKIRALLGKKRRS